MTNQKYIDIFYTLIEHLENEVIEFKKAERNFDSDDLGKYFSALSNEANLRSVDFAWLIMGYHELTHTITGTSFKNSEDGLNKLKHDIALNSGLIVKK